MKMVITNEGKVDLLFNALVAPPDYLMEDWWVQLFTNDVLVAADSNLATFDLASFSGSDPIPITRASFMGVAIVGDVGRTGRTDPVSWTCGAGTPQTVYGWIMWGQTTGATLAGQNFDVPRVMSEGSIEDISPFNFDLTTLCLCAA